MRSSPLGSKTSLIPRIDQRRLGPYLERRPHEDEDDYAGCGDIVRGRRGVLRCRATASRSPRTESRPTANPTHTEWSGKFDGKDYPVTGSPDVDMRAFTQVNDHILKISEKKGGKVVTTGRSIVSTDG